jgi:hypothetical protein
MRQNIKKRIIDLTIIFFILLLMSIFFLNAIIESKRELRITIDQNYSTDDLELLLVAQSIIYNYWTSDNVPMKVKDLSFSLKFKVIANNSNKIQYFTEKDIQSFEDIYIIYEPLVLLKKKKYDILSTLPLHLPLAYKKIDNNRIKVFYIVQGVEPDTCFFTKEDFKKGIKVMNIQDIHEEVEVFIRTITSLPRG